MASTVPVSEFKGFTICRFSSSPGDPVDKIDASEKAYQTLSHTMKYYAKQWIYRLFLKV